MMLTLYIGCPIWANKGWVGNFFPAGTKAGEFLREYSRRLTTVEGNTTFYAVPSALTVQEWAAQTPETFRFCFKVPRTISHAGALTPHIDDARRFIEQMSPLGSRLGPMFLQLPPQYSPNFSDDLASFLDAWPAMLPLAVEVRHLRWFETPGYDKLNEMLSERSMARVVIDTRPIRNLQGDKILAGSVYERLLQSRERKPDLPIKPVQTASFTFLRYIGHPQNEINAPFLDEWVDYLATLPADRREAYVFCHCPYDVQAPVICREFYTRIAKRITVPELPWDTAEPDLPHQPRLL